MISQTSGPSLTEIVLVGAGHAHVQVMHAFGLTPMPGVRVTVIADQLLAPYSGMLPGCIAGDYTAAEIQIDLARLARHAGCRLIHASAIGVDRASRQVLLQSCVPVPYDWLSINVGITPDLSGIAGAADHAVPVKPIAGLLQRLEQADATVRALGRPARLAVVGGGAGGIEIAIALNDRYRSVAQAAAAITLIAGGGLAPALNNATRRHARQALKKAGITIIEGDRAQAIEADRVLLASGRRVAADVALLSTDARLPEWLHATDLPKAGNGGVAVRQTLQVADDNAIFAAGDCATMVEDPRPRAGLFAVRQGPVLACNLQAAARGGQLERYIPQRDFLTILRTGRTSAIAGRGRWFSVSGPRVRRWKDRIDRAFMERLAVPEEDRRDKEHTLRREP